MNSGVLYYNMGTRLLVRLCVSIRSLRQVYDGPITVISSGKLPRWVRRTLAGLGARITAIDVGEGVSSRTAKASLWRYSPFGVTLFVDSDTVVLEDPTPLFEVIAEQQFVVTQFANWTTMGRRMAGRIRQWGAVLDEAGVAQALDYGPAVNTGVVGWRKDATILPAWEHTARLGWRYRCTRRMIDELACQVLLPAYPHHVVDDRWNWSTSYGTAPQPAIIHYHGNKHAGDRPANRHWKDAYWALRNTSRWEAQMGRAQGDRSLGSYLQRTVHDDVTAVTVVNQRYADKLAANWPLWMETEGLREQRYVVFAVGRPDLGFLRPWRNVTVIPWDQATDDRARCLSTFVFGVAEHIHTPYWMKLDCDARPKGATFAWPAYHGSTITAHRWGYTKVKGDPNATRHWLNVLDAWWGGEALFPAGLPVRRRHGHRRINSFCSIEKTEFTRRLAERCGQDLPVPSQDTTAWYAATRWGEPIQRVNMKKWLCQ